MTGVPIGFNSVEEFEAWKAELHGAQARLTTLAEAAEKKREQLLADEVSRLGGGILGTALPEEVRDALGKAKVIAGFLPYLPDVELPTWSQRVADILALVARALGV